MITLIILWVVMIGFFYAVAAAIVGSGILIAALIAIGVAIYKAIRRAME